MANKKKLEEKINANTMPIVIYVPKSSIRLTAQIDIIADDLSLHQAECVYDTEMLRDCMIDGDAWAAENEKYVLVDRTED